jgi:NAD(P)-dependent dehydrogenase (short-subunit alcohol dehydrogenase family)
MSNKVALVTNVTELAGLACARALLRDGFTVVCHDAKFGAADARSAFQRENSGLNASAEVEPENLVEDTLKIRGHIDVLFSNDVFAAGTGPIEDISVQQFRDTIEGLMVIPFRLCRAVVPQMKARRAGHIILFSSAAPLMPFPYFSSYCAARSGATNLAVSLSKELGPHNVQINAVLSQFMHSEKYFPRSLFKDGSPAAEFLKVHCPLQRLGEQEEMAELVAFLASGKCNFVNGQLIPFTGGWPSAASFPAKID